LILYGASEEIAAWAADKFGEAHDYFDPCEAIGIVADGQIIAGVIYNNQRKHKSIPFTLEMTVASIDKRWATRHNLRALFGYPFTQLGLRRVETQCDSDNEGAVMFNKRLGFKEEGKHKQAFPTGNDSLSFGMLKDDCKWL